MKKLKLFFAWYLRLWYSVYRPKQKQNVQNYKHC